MKPRVTEYWHPDNATIFIRRGRDKRLVTSALISAAVIGMDGAGDFVNKWLPELAATDTPDELGFDREETPLVISALALYSQTHQQHAVQQRRASSLISAITETAKLE